MRCLAITLSLLCSLASAALGQTAGMLGFQGVIKDTQGNLIQGNVAIEFRIFNAQSGGQLVAGPFGPNAVSVAGGVVNTSFGPVPAAAFDGTKRWLEATIDNSPLPRVEFVMAPATAEQVNRPGTAIAAIVVGASDNVRIGSNAIPTDLDVRGRIAIDGQLVQTVDDGTLLRLGDISSADGFINRVEVRTNDETRLVVDGEGDVGIGTTPDEGASLHIQRPGALIKLQDSATDTHWWMRQNGGGQELAFGYGAAAIDDNIKMRVHSSGVSEVQVLRITGGADLAEPFDIGSHPTEATTIKSGMVVVIDAGQPGKLRIATEPYDAKVAGVISGANGLSPGMIMKAEGTAHANGEHPVALSGRVYVWADATYGAIVPGDRLTTSATPGHAMKATDRDRAVGAVIGKAMTKLESGTGFVLVLVQPQ